MVSPPVVPEGDPRKGPEGARTCSQGLPLLRTPAVIENYGQGRLCLLPSQRDVEPGSPLNDEAPHG